VIAAEAWRIRLLYLALSALVFGLDRFTKLLVMDRLPLHASVPVVEGFFDLTHVTNTGALFGILSGLAPPLRGAVFVAIPILAVVLILVFQLRSSARDALAQVGLALILGGALGNLTDRIAWGHVVDFLDFSVAGRHWPAFNLADSSICCGVGALILDLIRRERSPAPEE
jgi:signal peptidase II